MRRRPTLGTLAFTTIKNKHILQIDKIK